MRNIKGSKVRNDIFLAVFLVSISLLALLVFKTTQKDGAYAVVIKDGVETSRYPLSKNREIKITHGEDGKKFNLLIIENGAAYIESASCPDGICVSHKPIKLNGETIICLPNKLVIKIESEKGEASLDSVG